MPRRRRREDPAGDASLPTAAAGKQAPESGADASASESQSPPLSAAGAIALVSFLLLATLVVFSVRSRSELRAGLAEADAGMAVRRLDAAVGWHFPGNPWSRRAAAELAGRARSLEEAGDRAGALALWRRIRPLAASTRSFTSPFAGLEAEAAIAIARIEAPERSGGNLPPPSEPPRDPRGPAVAGLGLALGGALVSFWKLLGEPTRTGRLRLAAIAASSAALFWLLLAVA